MDCAHTHSNTQTIYGQLPCRNESDVHIKLPRQGERRCISPSDCSKVSVYKHTVPFGKFLTTATLPV
jgi:hypothetical protein